MVSRKKMNIFVRKQTPEARLGGLTLCRGGLARALPQKSEDHEKEEDSRDEPRNGVGYVNGGEILEKLEGGEDPDHAEYTGAKEGDKCRDGGFSKTADGACAGVHDAEDKEAGPLPEESYHSCVMV